MRCVCYFDLCCGNSKCRRQPRTWSPQPGVRVKFACQNQMRQFWQLAGLIICIQIIVMTLAMSAAAGAAAAAPRNLILTAMALAPNSTQLDLAWPGLKPHTKHMTLPEFCSLLKSTLNSVWSWFSGFWIIYLHGKPKTGAFSARDHCLESWVNDWHDEGGFIYLKNSLTIV